MKPLALIALIPLALIAGIIAFALVFGGPRDPPPMPSISNPFKNVDFSDMAATRRFAGRDGKGTFVQRELNIRKPLWLGSRG